MLEMRKKTKKIPQRCLLFALLEHIMLIKMSLDGFLELHAIGIVLQ